MTPPRCPICGPANEPHRILIDGPSATSDFAYGHHRFWDEQGYFHEHDCSPVWPDRYRCNHGHKWAVEYPQHSCWCGWTMDKSGDSDVSWASEGQTPPPEQPLSVLVSDVLDWLRRHGRD